MVGVDVQGGRGGCREGHGIGVCVGGYCEALLGVEWGGGQDSHGGGELVD